MSTLNIFFLVESEQFKESIHSKNIHENYSPLIIQARATTSIENTKKKVYLFLYA